MMADPPELSRAARAGCRPILRRSSLDVFSRLERDRENWLAELSDFFLLGRPGVRDHRSEMVLRKVSYPAENQSIVLISTIPQRD